MRLPPTAIILATAIALFASRRSPRRRSPSSRSTSSTPGSSPATPIWVTDAQGREIKGRIEALAPEAHRR